jgi:hypothetical protein
MPTSRNRQLKSALQIFSQYWENQFFGESWQLQKLCRLKILEHNFYDRANKVWLPAYPLAKSAITFF